MRLKALPLGVALALLAGSAVTGWADDGQLSRKSMSSSSGTVDDPVPEAEHAFIDYMKLYVPAQAANGVITPIEYFTADESEDAELIRELARPLIGVYIYGPVVGVDGVGFVGHGARDAFAAVSLDDGETWKRSNLSESADKSSFEVSVPFPDPTQSSSEPDIEFDPDGLVIDTATATSRGASAVKTLVVTGAGAIFRKTVEVRDALTREILGSTKVKRDGTYTVRVNRVDPVPCLVQAGVDGVFGPAIEVEGAPEECADPGGPNLITEYPGDVINIFHAVAGDRVIVAWPSRFCQTGTPGYTLDDEGTLTDDGSAVAGYLGIDHATDLYLRDLFGVAGSQGSVDYSDDEFEQNQPVGEVPFSCLWTARGVLVQEDDPKTVATEASHMVWFKPERLTSGRSDVNRVEIQMVEGAGAVVTWQEDPEGLRPGQGEGPGEGWSGAIANNQTDVWYSFLPWEQFDIVDADEGPVPLAEYTGEEKPGHYVPFAVPMRLTNNAKCNVPEDDDEGILQANDQYCYGETLGGVAENYGLQDNCADTATIPQGQNREGDICIAESGLPNIGNTAATRPRLSLQPRNTDDDDLTDSAWVVVIAEEDKGFGRYLFEVGETGVDTATPCETEEEGFCEVADQGKNIWYFS
ncbi:MAG: choice-of-anchor O protein, partial [Candidatus Nanopelagicales bacterium]|nr:choice-of-anchor O protein [Candidatus Nanopelagicales bacterium]